MATIYLWWAAGGIPGALGKKHLKEIEPEGPEASDRLLGLVGGIGGMVLEEAAEAMVGKMNQGIW